MLAQLASLQELRIELKAWVGPLPPWLTKLPAFSSLRIWLMLDAPSPIVDSVCSMTGLRDLSIDFHQLIDISDYNEEEGLLEHEWHICGTHTRTLRALVLECSVLPLVDGLLTLERHVAVFVRCTCSSRGCWYESHAEYAAVQPRLCVWLEPGDARQLFKDTRRPAHSLPTCCSPYA
eukprot:jgi/Mesen1/3190/ME000184S02256